VDDIAEKIRVRIMQEAYDLADRNDSEGYNSVKVMCSDVLALLPRREWVGLTDEDRNDCLVSADPCECLAKPESHQLMEDVEAKLREKNT